MLNSLRLSTSVVVAWFALSLSACVALGQTAPTNSSSGEPAVVAPKARVETEPVPSSGDAADDPAIWIHPDDQSKSLVLGTDKKGGLNVFDMDGKRLQIVSDGSRPNNVDVIYDFPLEGRTIDLAVAGTRKQDELRHRILAHRPGIAQALRAGTAAGVSRLRRWRALWVLRLSKPQGQVVLFVRHEQGRRRRAVPDRSGIVRRPPGRFVPREFAHFAWARSPRAALPTTTSAGFMSVKRNVGIWRFGAEPDSGEARTLVARVGENGLAADVEGLTIYYAAGSGGYLIASSQGRNTFQVYRRDGSNAFVTTIDPSAGTIAKPGETDGIDVTNVATSSKFPRGLFVCQDGNPGREGRQNFKFFAWDEIAGNRLTVDTEPPGAATITPDPRPGVCGVSGGAVEFGGSVQHGLTVPSAGQFPPGARGWHSWP